MTIDEWTDKRTAVNERAGEFLEIMEWLANVIFAIRDLEVKDPRDRDEKYLNNHVKRARRVLEAAQEDIESRMGVSFYERYEGRVTNSNAHGTRPVGVEEGQASSVNSARAS